MRVDENIAKAIERYLIEKNSTARELCKIVGISEPAMIKWRRPGKGILQRNWMLLFPLIKKYLPKDRIYIDENGEEQYSSTLEGTGGNPYFHPKFIPQMVPVFTFEQLSKFNTMIMTTEQYAIQLECPRIEYRPRIQGFGSGVFAMNVNFESSIIPKGALLFASSEVRPKNNSIVIFSDNAGNVKIGRYSIIADKFSIVADDGKTGGSIEKIREKISFIFPVLYYEVVTF